MKRVMALMLAAMLLLCACSKTDPAWQDRFDLGSRYLSDGDYEEAILYFTAAIEIDPRQPDAYVFRGDAYALAAYEYAVAGDFVTVREYLEKARQDYIAAQELGADDDYDLEDRHQEINDLEEQVAQAQPETEPVNDIYREFFYSMYTDEDMVCLADVTGDGIDEMMVVHYEDPDGNRICGYVYSLVEGQVSLIYSNWGSTAHVGGFYGWYLVDNGGNYGLAEESFGMWQGMGTLSFVEYTLDVWGNKNVTHELVLDSAEEGNHDSNGVVTDAAFEDYQKTLAQRMARCYAIHNTYTEGIGGQFLETFPPVVFGSMDDAAPETVSVEDTFAEVYRNPYYDGTYCIHIPRFVLSDNRAEIMNEQIYQDLMGIMNQNAGYSSDFGNQPTVSITYSMGQANGIASIVANVSNQEYDYWNYRTYNLNVNTGWEAADQEVMAAFGYTEDSFREKVRQVLEGYFEKQNGQIRDMVGEELYRQMLEETISAENVNAARPFIDEAGRLCMVATVHGFAGAGAYNYRICMEGNDFSADPQWITCQVHG